MKKKRIFSLLLASALTFTGTASAFAKTITNPELSSTISCNYRHKNNNNAHKYKKHKNNIPTSVVSTEDEKKVKISKEKAKKIAKVVMKTYFNTDIDESEFTQRINLNTTSYNGKQNSSWNIAWNINNMKRSINIYVSLNAETGTVTQVSNYEKLSNEDNSGNYGSANYSFNYINKVNGIEFEGNKISVEIDVVKGKIVSYYNNWDEDLRNSQY